MRFVLLIVVGLVAACAPGGGGLAMRQENNGLKAEVNFLQAELTAKNIEVAALKVEVDASKKAGGDINSTTALIVAIVSAMLSGPLSVFGYVVSKRFGIGRAVIHGLSGKPGMSS